MVAGFHPLGQASPKSDQGKPTPALKSTAILRPEKMHPCAGGEPLLGGHGPIPQELGCSLQLRDHQSRIGGRKAQSLHKADGGNHQRLNQAPDHTGQNSQQQPSAVRTRHLPKPAQESNHVLPTNMPSRRAMRRAGASGLGTKRFSLTNPRNERASHTVYSPYTLPTHTVDTRVMTLEANNGRLTLHPAFH